jgi:CopA family copper-resistance protein
VPAPTLLWREGDTLTLAVTNRLDEPSSIHWHGVRVPSPMDGVPGLSFRGIAPGETFVYRFPVHQSGTYWYHSHTMFQEQTGLYGALVIEPKGGYRQAFDRDYVVLLSDWTPEAPDTLVSNLKQQSDYYNFRQRTLGTFIDDIKRNGLGATISERLEWGKMRMSPTDILDVSGATYSYLINGYPADANWTALFKPGERVRLRFINASSMSIFDVRIDGLPMMVVQADGNDVVPVVVDEFRISVAETYDVIVTPLERAYTLFVQSEDRTGFARGTLAPKAGMQAPIPPMDARPMRTMADMGMGGMEPGAMAGMDMSGMKAPDGDANSMPGMEMGAMQESPAANDLEGKVGVDNVAMMPTERLQNAGDGLPSGRRVSYADLRASKPGADQRPPTRTITLHLTGNMQRFMWGFDGKKFSESMPGASPCRRGSMTRRPFKWAWRISRHCAVCHGAPDVPPGDIADGLYPKPPDLAAAAKHSSDAELFWTVKNGIKMTGMPSWSDHSDEELWATVAFVRKLPGMSEAEYAKLIMASMAQGGHRHSDMSHAPTDPAAGHEHQ